MSVPFVQRELSLIGAAVLAAVVGLAIAARHHTVSASDSRLPPPAVSQLSGWYSSLAGVRRRPLASGPSACGTLLNPKTLGIDHPVLPCGAKIYVAYNGRTVLTTVVDRGPLRPGYEFELTPALAELVGLNGVQRIRWSFTRPS